MQDTILSPKKVIRDPNNQFSLHQYLLHSNCHDNSMKTICESVASHLKIAPHQVSHSKFTERMMGALKVLVFILSLLYIWHTFLKVTESINQLDTHSKVIT